MNSRMQEFFDVIVGNPNLTEREIADRVGLKKTPYSRRILLDLIAEGAIVRTQDPTKERFTYVYAVQETDALPGMLP